MTQPTKSDPQCMAGSLSHPGCAATRLQERIKELEELLARRAAERDAVPVAWISVDERLPEPDAWVIAHNGKWTGIAMHATLKDDGYMEESERWQDEHTEYVEHLGPKVTHWQPLPAAPEK